MAHPKGHIPWNKGLRQNHTCIDCQKEISYYCKRCKKCAGKVRIGNKNSWWKGDKVGYSGIHIWLNQKFGKANKCENIDCLEISKRYYWAKLKGKEYERKRENFWMLCASCHINYDMTEEWGKKISKARKGILPWNTGKKWSSKMRLKMSLSHQGKKLSEATKQKLKGRIPWNKGKTLHYKVWNKGLKYHHNERKSNR